MTPASNTAIHRTLAAAAGRLEAKTGDMVELRAPVLLGKEPGPINAPEIATYDGTLLHPGDVAYSSAWTAAAAGGLSAVTLRVPDGEIVTVREGRKLPVHIPEVSRILVVGAPVGGEAAVSGLDVALAGIAQLGPRHTLGAGIEFDGEALAHLHVEARAAACSLAPLVGAMCMMFVADRRIVTEIRRFSERRFDTMLPAAEAGYGASVTVDLSASHERVMLPDNVIVRPDDIVGTRVDRIVVCGVGGAGYSHLAMLAKALRGRERHPAVAMSVQPATPAVEERARQKGLLADLEKFGAKVIAASLTLPLAQGGERVLVTGADAVMRLRALPGAQVMLAGPSVAAAAALTGAIGLLSGATQPFPGDSKVSTRRQAAAPGAESPLASARRRPAQ